MTLGVGGGGVDMKQPLGVEVLLRRPTLRIDFLMIVSATITAALHFSVLFACTDHRLRLICVSSSVPPPWVMMALILRAVI